MRCLLLGIRLPGHCLSPCDNFNIIQIDGHQSQLLCNMSGIEINSKTKKCTKGFQKT